MKLLLLVAAFFAIAAVIYAYFKLQKQEVQESSYRKRRLLNSAEQTMYWRLVKALPDHIILAQVGMTRCVGIKGPALAILSRESLDFVVCSKAMQIIAAIELEDDTSRSAIHQKLGQLKEEALGIAGIKLIKWPANPLPSEGYISMEFNNQSLATTRLAA